MTTAPDAATTPQWLNDVRARLGESGDPQVARHAVNTAAIHNHFFEGNISVAGLLTGRDIAEHLRGMGAALGERVIVPSIMLRDPDRDIFLDDMTLPELSERIGRDVYVAERMPSAAARAVLG